MGSIRTLAFSVMAGPLPADVAELPFVEHPLDFLVAASAHLSNNSVDETLAMVSGLAVATVEGCLFAGIARLGDSKDSSETANALAGVLKRQQVDHDSGPLIDAIVTHGVVYAEDLVTDSRWPGFAAVALMSQIRSVLAIPLLHGDHQGALVLYSHYPSAFGAVDRARALLLASLGALTLTLALDHDDDVAKAKSLATALVTREIIGQAQGILMERERITAEQAFTILRRASQHLNVKLRDVAQDLVQTGSNPMTVSLEVSQSGTVGRKGP